MTTQPSRDLFDKYTAPVYLKMLSDKVGTKEAADLVGMSYSHVGKCVAGATPTSTTLEAAARGIYREKFEGDRTILVSGSAHTIGRVEELLRLADIRASVVNLNVKG